MDLGITTSRSGDYTVVAVSGEVDIYSAPQLDAVLSELIAAGQVALVVDLTEVGFLDSTGLGVLVKALKRCREANGSVAVVTQGERVLRVFAITGLDAVIPVHPTLAAALEPAGGDGFD